MNDPIAIFSDWFAQARACEAIADATAMALATAGADGAPSVRIVLLKGFDTAGFVFYTNTQSRKGRDLQANPRTALAFYWAPLDKQVRIEGTVSPVSDAEADAYFATRERLKQAGAWASLQSQPLADRDALMTRVEEIEQRFAGQSIPRPPHWSGYRLQPQRIEFWHQRDARLHVRDNYERTADGQWQHSFLYP